MDKVKLSEIADIKMGQSPEGDTCNDTGEGTPLLNGPTEFTDFYPIPKQFTTDPKRFSEVGDILFCVRGSTTGRMNWSDQSYAIGRGLASLSHKMGKEINFFLKYLIQFNLDSILKSTSGSTFPNLTNDILANLELLVPDFPTQQKIAAVFSALDAKIELNKRINTELESMAKTLYDYWFVQFDFPNEQGKPHKSSGGKLVWNEELKRRIPVGWEVKMLAEITEVSTESVNPRNSPKKEFKHYSIPAFDETGIFKVEFGEEIMSNKFAVRGSDLLVSKLNPWFNRVVYATNDSDLICSSEFVVWRTESTAIKNFLYMIAKDSPFVKYCTRSATGTSHSHRRVISEVMMKYKIPYNKELAMKFGVTMDSSIKMLAKNRLESQTLKELRDWLLPMLMNGQVKVS